MRPECSSAATKPLARFLVRPADTSKFLRANARAAGVWVDRGQPLFVGKIDL